MNIYLDETGQFTKHKDGKFFLVGTFTTGDPKRTEKRFKSWKTEKFPRKLRHLPEVKFSNPTINDDLRLRTLRTIANLDIRIRYSFLRRENIPLNYRYKGKVRTGHLYTDIVSKTLESYLPITEKDFRVFCDERHLKGLKRSEFKSILTSNLLSQMTKGTIVQIEMLNSTTNANIQIADWVCGALGRYHNQGSLGDQFFRILKNNLINEGSELFNDYWEKLHQKTQSAD